MKYIFSASILLLFSGFLGAQSTVFPGDANANGIVDQYDVLSIGFAYGHTGPARILTEDLSTQSIAEEWPGAFPGGLNFIHADADGNGAVTMFDFFTWNQNYGITNGAVSGLPIPDPDPTANSAVIWNNNQLVAPLTGGQVLSIPLQFSFPVTQSVNGVAFRLRYQTDHFAAAELNLSSNWLVNDGNGLSLQKNPAGSFEVGISRFGNSPVAGGGAGGTLNLIVIDDMIALLETAPDTVTSWLVMENVLVIDGLFEPVPIAVDSFQLKLYRPGITAGNTALVNELQARVFPNPASGTFNLQAAFPYRKTFIFNALGQLVFEQEHAARLSWTASDLSLKPGYYLIRVEGEEGASSLKIMIQ